ncbi:MAG: hypothetical protein CM15mV25_0160 [uncultured marine virus]|nr:MAG: hypothetical protein CM15mV25_0160 [uncultured marine virus]
MYTMSRLNNLISYQQISWQYQLTQQLVQVAIDGSINCVKIKSAGSGGTDGATLSLLKVMVQVQLAR